MLYEKVVSPKGKVAYLPVKEYSRPADGIVLVRTTPHCKSTTVLFHGDVEVERIRDAISNHDAVNALCQREDELMRAVTTVISARQGTSYNIRELAEQFIKEFIGVLQAKARD